MNAGIISKRYAKAIFLYASEHEAETRLRSEMKALSEQFVAVPLLKKVLDDPTVSPADKIKALITAAGKDVSDTYRHVIGMVIGNGRGQYMQSIALMYEKVYRKEKNMIMVKLTTVEPASQKTKKALINLIAGIKTGIVDFEVREDATILGGFMLAVEDSRLDASVKGQLNRLKLELIKN
ncbi:MAG: F0F1 ATP synthase subunit delta [Dysgonamonadaceae bacterium]|jgi:F-type H+-transporting ATPase subunit delta|nr:F0F1 ATP synthase subunit delta [Dysgonamonadaceae bacterium]